MIHFSGLKSIKESINHPLKYWENNVVGSINLLKMMDKYECKTIIFSSSATIYNNFGKEKIKENCSINLSTPMEEINQLLSYF